MKELQRKQRIKRIIYSVPSLILLSFVAFFIAKGAVKILGKEQESSARARELEARVSALVLREQELKEGIARLETEEGVKEEIKDRFNVTEEGEHVAIIVDEKRSATSTNASELSWYKRLLDAIMGH